MQKRFTRHAGLLIGGIVLLQLTLFAAYLLAMNGFCFQQRRFLPRDEVERAAIAYTLATYPPSIELSRRTQADGNIAVTYGRPAHPVPITGVNAFQTLYPDGCRILPATIGELLPTHLSRLFGVSFYTVRMHYTVHFYENGTRRAVPHERFITVNRCGRVVTL